MASALKRLLVGKPIPSSEADHQRLSNIIALPVFSSEAISSTAFATGVILAVTAVGGSSLALGASKLVPIAVLVAVILVIVVISYRQTIFAYPSGGGSYVVSRENLGEKASTLAAASLLIDYVLTVAVSISAGVEAIISLNSDLDKWRVPICLGLIGLMTLLNLRGLKESGSLFAPPVYIYIAMVVLLLAVAAWKGHAGTLGQVVVDDKLKDEKLMRLIGGQLGLGLILKGFASGAVALTGVEAISNGVPAFKRPESRNASRTMIYMGVILGTLFFGTAILAHHTLPYPSSKKTAVAQMGEVVFGRGFLLVVLQISTAAILTLAANTAYADFPRLAQLIAKDGYLPRQFANLGDRLVFSNGVLVLAGAACALIVAFGGETTALIPLYAVGVFTAFTLSQAGMVRYHLREKHSGWQLSSVINTIGAIATFVVLLIVAITKFTGGAWIPIVIVPPIMVVFGRIKHHYERVATQLHITPEMVKHDAVNHTVIVLVGRMHKGVLKALDYAQSLRPQHLIGVYVSSDPEKTQEIERQWREFRVTVPLEVVHTPYRDLVEPIKKYIEEVDSRWSNDTITIVIPEFVTTKWYQAALHNQTALRLKGALLFREGLVVTSVPYLGDGTEATEHMEIVKASGSAPATSKKAAASKPDH